MSSCGTEIQREISAARAADKSSLVAQGRPNSPKRWGPSERGAISPNGQRPGGARNPTPRAAVGDVYGAYSWLPLRDGASGGACRSVGEPTPGALTSPSPTARRL